jgi:hypothetical protein
MNIFTFGFLLIPIAAIAANEVSSKKVSLWFIFIVYVLVGWLLWNLSVWWYFQQLDELVRSTPHPSAELLEKWQNDGAANVFALYFGWLFAAVYFLVCVVIVFAIREIGKQLMKGKK